MRSTPSYHGLQFNKILSNYLLIIIVLSADFTVAIQSQWSIKAIPFKINENLSSTILAHVHNYNGVFFTCQTPIRYFKYSKLMVVVWQKAHGFNFFKIHKLNFVVVSFIGKRKKYTCLGKKFIKMIWMIPQQWATSV